MLLQQLLHFCQPYCAHQRVQSDSASFVVLRSAGSRRVSVRRIDTRGRHGGVRVARWYGRVLAPGMLRVLCLQRTTCRPDLLLPWRQDMLRSPPRGDTEASLRRLRRGWCAVMVVVVFSYLLHWQFYSFTIIVSHITSIAAFHILISSVLPELV